MRIRLTVPVLAVLLAPAVATAACTVSAESIAFGTVTVDRMNFARGYVRVSCDLAADVRISISPGSSGDYAWRHMVGPKGTRLLYQIYTNQQTYDIWGDGRGGTATVGGHLEPGEEREFPMHGFMPAQPGVPEGDYADSLTVTLEF